MNEERRPLIGRGRDTFGSASITCADARGSRYASQVVTRVETSVRKAKLKVLLG